MFKRINPLIIVMLIVLSLFTGVTAKAGNEGPNASGPIVPTCNADTVFQGLKLYPGDKIPGTEYYFGFLEIQDPAWGVLVHYGASKETSGQYYSGLGTVLTGTTLKAGCRELYFEKDELKIRDVLFYTTSKRLK